jgi:hypothetical protein
MQGLSSVVLLYRGAKFPTLDSFFQHELMRNPMFMPLFRVLN